VIWSMVYLNDIGLITLGLCLGVAHGLFYPAYTAMVLVDSPAVERGRRLSIIQASLNFGIGAGAIVLGWTAARWGYPVIFQISAWAIVLAAALVIFDTRSAEVPKHERDEPGNDGTRPYVEQASPPTLSRRFVPRRLS
jgi:MFS family permease